MLILTLRTDNPEAEIGLYEDDKQLAYETWTAHRQLAETLHRQIAKNLQFLGKKWGDIEGIVVFEGPGSFTGLRIGISVANALANSSRVPVISVGGEKWLEAGLEIIKQAAPGSVALPNYGSEAKTSPPRK